MFGVSKVTALALLAAITATTCVVLFARAQRLFGGLVASLTLLLFLGSATVRWHSLLVMSDLLTTLFCMLSGFALADFLMGRRSRDLVMASIWTAIAMMTKETAVHLLFLAPVLFVVADGMACLRDRRIQILAGGLLALGAATLSFRLSSGFGLHGYRDFGQLLSRMTQWNDARRIIAAFLEISPPFILFLASCGFIVKFGRRLPNDTRVHLQLSVCWISVVIGFFLMSPALPDGRYFMPALIPLMMLIAHLFHAIRESLAERFRSGAWIVPATLAVTAVLTSPQSNEGAIRGYASVARAIPVRPNVTMLISSNPFGEGAFITERLLFDREQQGIVLRGSKVLSTSDWHGTDYQLSKQDSDEILDFLRSFPVHYIIVDEHRFTNEPPPPDRELLRRALREHPQEFRETGRFPLSRGSDRFDQAFTIYENLGAKESASSTFEVPLNYSLNRALRLKPTPR